MQTTAPQKKTGAGPNHGDKADARKSSPAQGTDSPDDSSLGRRLQAGGSSKLQAPSSSGEESLDARADEARAKLKRKLVGPGEFKMLDPATIERSPFNRTRFNEAKHLEMVESVRAHGVIEPIVVRPRNLAGQKSAVFLYELVAGERRLRASNVAKLREIPAMIRVLSDEEVIEQQAIENLHREDLAAIDEAEKYDQLLGVYKKRGLNPDQAMAELEERSGKKRSTIYGKLRLLKLPADIREAVATGKLPASHAEEIVKLIDWPEEVKAVAKRVLHPQRGDEKEGENILTFRQTKQWVEETATAARKRDEWEKIAAEAKKNGQPVLSEAQCKKALPYDTPHLAHDSGYVKGSDANYEFTPAGNRYRTFGELMGKHAPQPTLGHTERFEIVELFPVKEARAAIIANGHKPWVQSTTSRSRTSSSGPSAKAREAANAARRREEAAAAKRREKLARMKQAESAAVTALVTAVEKPKAGVKFPWPWFVEQLLESSIEPNEVLLKRRQLKTADDYMSQRRAIIALVPKLTQAQIAGLLIELAITGGEGAWSEFHNRWSDPFVKACKHFGVDLKKIEAQFAEPPKAKPKPATPAKVKPAKRTPGRKKAKAVRGGLSAAGRRKLAQAMKARWAARRKDAVRKARR
jgi:ParB/RepB/Spo0J family partition protein